MRLHGNIPPPPPVAPKRQSTHTHGSTTGPAEPDQYFSPFKEQNSENGFGERTLQTCLDLGFFFFYTKHPICKVLLFYTYSKIIPGLNLFSFSFELIDESVQPW